MYTIREYGPLDRQAILDLISELQEYERILEDDRLPGPLIAEEHLAYLLRQCEEKTGRILASLVEDRLTGYVCGWLETDFGEHLVPSGLTGYISDLVVRPELRGGGLGRELLEAAERYLLDRGATSLSLYTLARNSRARAFYASAGYRDYEIVMIKHGKARPHPFRTGGPWVDERRI
jgi:ribosomal protein S18 acetylase RimI-like enzyme